jgi:SAM-dependent methyltransferase
MNPLSTEATRHNSYDPAFFQSLFEVEDRHFWFRARNRVIAATVERLVSGLAPGYRVLEVGCGTGNVLRVLEAVCSTGMVCGMDLFAEGLVYASQRTRATLVQGDIHQPPFAAPFEVVGLFDVLEHLPEDVQVLRDIHRMLMCDGVLVLTVPAHPALWSYFDEASHHLRRYVLSELNGKLVAAGYDIEYSTEYMMSIFPLVWAGRPLSSLRRRVSGQQSDASKEDLAIQELRPIPILNRILSPLLDIEGRWLARGRTLPLGTSLLTVARKRG